MVQELSEPNSNPKEVVQEPNPNPKAVAQELSEPEFMRESVELLQDAGATLVLTPNPNPVTLVSSL